MPGNESITNIRKPVGESVTRIEARGRRLPGQPILQMIFNSDRDYCTPGYYVALTPTP